MSELTKATLPEGMTYVQHCPWCAGNGEYEQTYTVGCGGGYYRSIGRCDGPCEGSGLVYTPTGKKPPASVLRQIEAARHD